MQKIRKFLSSLLLVSLFLPLFTSAQIPSDAITDNKGNTYYKVDEGIYGIDHAAIFYAKNVTGGSSFTVSTELENVTLSVHEYSGMDAESPLDQHANNDGTGTAINSGNVTTSNLNELVFGVAWSDGTGNFTAGSGYARREQETDNMSYERHASEDKFLSSATTTNAAFTITGSNPWTAVIATFKPANTAGNSTTTMRYVHTDHLGGTSVVTDQNGAIQESVDYLPFGGLRIDSKVGGFAGEKRKFAGTENDGPLNYMVNRYQNPAQGRFISQDPVFWEVGLTKDGKEALVNPQSLNSYSYANNNPIVLKDPNGRWVESGFDAAMLALSVNSYRSNPSFLNAVGVGIDALSMAIPAMPALGGALLRGEKIFQTANRTSAVSDVWKLPSFVRGYAIEAKLGGNLPKSFPVIDRYDSATGLVTSIKSLDLGAKTYQNASALNRTVTGYIDSVAGFKGATLSGETIGDLNKPIYGRALDLAIPNGGNTAQQKVLNQAVEYGKSLGVQVNLKQI